MTLGGGTEVCLPAASIQASSETYMGLVEVGVGLIPGGGGNKELYIKHLNKMPNGVEFDLQKVANKVFESVAMAKVSTSAQEAVSNNFLGDKDGISVNGDHLLYDAKQKALALYEAGYKAPIRKRYQLLVKQDMQLLYLVQKQCIYQVTFLNMIFTLRRNLHMSLRAEKCRTEQKLMSSIY